MVASPPARSGWFAPIRVALVGAVVSALTACGATSTELPAQSRLPAPGNLTVQAAGLSVTLSWDRVSGASSYLVYWAQDSTVTPESGTRANSPSPPYVHQASTFGATYAYLVIAVDAVGLAGRTSPVVTVTPTGSAPQAPQNIRATAGDRQVTLDWDPVDGATGYQIEVTSQFGTFSVPDPVAPPFIHRSLLNCVPRSQLTCAGYQYRVRGKFGTLLGPWSLPVAAVPMPTTPGSPVFTDVRARTTVVKTDANPIGTPQGSVLLSWSPADHARDYQVYVKTAPDGPEEPLIDSVSFPLRTTTYVHMPVDFGASYTYRVEAINDGVTSQPIDEGPGSVPPQLTPDRARASVPIPLAPGVSYSYVVRGFDGAGESLDLPVTSVEPSDGSPARDLSWIPPSGAGVIGQRLYRATTATNPFELVATFADLTVSSYRDEAVPLDPVPTGLMVAQQATDLLVSWSPISDAPSGYRLYWWEQAPGGGGSTGSTQIPTTAYQHEGLQSGSTYIYAVQVEGAAGVSPSVSAVAP